MAPSGDRLPVFGALAHPVLHCPWHSVDRGPLLRVVVLMACRLWCVVTEVRLGGGPSPGHPAGAGREQVMHCEDYIASQGSSSSCGSASIARPIFIDFRLAEHSAEMCKTVLPRR